MPALFPYPGDGVPSVRLSRIVVGPPSSSITLSDVPLKVQLADFFAVYPAITKNARASSLRETSSVSLVLPFRTAVRIIRKRAPNGWFILPDAQSSVDECPYGESDSLQPTGITELGRPAADILIQIHAIDVSRRIALIRETLAGANQPSIRSSAAAAPSPGTAIGSSARRCSANARKSRWPRSSVGIFHRFPDLVCILR